MLKDVKRKHLQVISYLGQLDILGSLMPTRQYSQMLFVNIESIMSAREKECRPILGKAHLLDWRTNSPNYYISLIFQCLFSASVHFAFRSMLSKHGSTVRLNFC